MGGYLSHFVPAQQSDVATQINVIEDGHKEFLYCMLEHICLCVVKEYLDGDGPGGKLRSFPVLRALLLYVRPDDLEGKPRLQKLLHVAIMVCHVYLATQKGSSDELRKKHLDALVVSMDSKGEASRPELPQSVVAKAKCCAVALTLAVDSYEKALEMAKNFCQDKSMTRYRRKLMQTLQSLMKDGTSSVEGVLEAFSMASFLEEFDSAVEELYAEFTPSVVEKVCEQLGMKKVLLFDPLEMLSKLDMPPPTTAWEGFEAAVERMARGEIVSGERQEASAEEEIGEEEEEEGKQGEEMEAEQGEDTKTTSSRRCGQQTSLERKKRHLRSSRRAPASYVQLSTSLSEEDEGAGFVPWKGRRRVHREQRSDNERRQTRQTPKKPEAYKRKVDSEEEEEDEEDAEEDEEDEEEQVVVDDEDEDEQVVVDEEDEEEDENRPEGDEESAKIWPHKGKRPRGHPPKITPQQEKTPRGRPPKIKPQQQTTGNRPKEHRSHKSGGREVLSPAVRRSPRKEGLKQTVKDFARQVQVEGHAEKPSERRSLKLAGRVLDPHVMSSSIESDTSSATHTVRHSPRKNPASATKNSTPRKVVDLDSFDQQPLGKKRKITPEMKERDYTRAANQSRSIPLSSDDDDDFCFFKYEEESPDLQSPSHFRPKVARYLNKKCSRKRVPWSHAEVSWLKKGVMLFGVGNWVDIKTHFPFSYNRIPADLKDKWRNLPQEEKKEVLRQ